MPVAGVWVHSPVGVRMDVSRSTTEKERIMKKVYASVLGIAMLLLAVAANAAEDPVGEWKGQGGRG